MELLKSLLTLWVLEETRQTWTMFSKLKAWVESEKNDNDGTRDFHF